MGRHFSEDHSLRIQVYLPGSEVKRIRELCVERNVNLSKLVRQAILNTYPKDPPKDPPKRKRRRRMPGETPRKPGRPRKKVPTEHYVGMESTTCKHPEGRIKAYSWGLMCSVCGSNIE